MHPSKMIHSTCGTRFIPLIQYLLFARHHHYFGGIRIRVEIRFSMRILADRILARLQIRKEIPSNDDTARARFDLRLTFHSVGHALYRYGVWGGRRQRVSISHIAASFLSGTHGLTTSCFMLLSFLLLYVACDTQ